MTEGNTQLTLHDDSIEQLIDTLEVIGEVEVYQPSPGLADRLETIANTIRAQYVGDTGPMTVIGLCGLPGVGKSYAAEKLSEMYDCPSYTMGDAIRREYALQEMGVDPDEWDGMMVSSDELGEFAAEKREEDPEQIPEWTVEMIRGSHPDVAIVDGVRSTTDYDVLDDHFDMELIQIVAPFQTRLNRLQDRGRDGEDEFDRVDLAERDLHELTNLGFRELLNEHPEMSVIRNEGDCSAQLARYVALGPVDPKN